MLWCNCKKFLAKYKGQLNGKKVVLFGSTGGIGKELSRYILELGGILISVDRNSRKVEELRQVLLQQFPQAEMYHKIADLEQLETVKQVCDELESMGVDVLIHNAGAYSIPRKICSTGYDNVFQINFISPYYITNRLMAHLEARKGRVVVVGSVAHNYSKTDQKDVDFSGRMKASLVYGNAKRYLMFAMLELMKEHPNVTLSVTHPGVAFTNITNHYPKLIFAIIKHPMKVIFMPPRMAALSIVQGIFDETDCYEWIGPSIFNVWGKQTKKTLHTCKKEEIATIYENAKRIYLESR